MISAKSKTSVFDVKGHLFPIFIVLIVGLLLFLTVELVDSNLFISQFLVENSIWHRILDVYLLIVSFSIFLISFLHIPKPKIIAYLS